MYPRSNRQEWRRQQEEEEQERVCGTCALCIHTYLGCVCSLTDNYVSYYQAKCIDYLKEDE